LTGAIVMTFAVIGIFLAQIAVIAVIINHNRTKARAAQDYHVQKKSITTLSYAGSEYFDGNRYFFEKETKTPPLLKIYGEAPQFGINIYSTQAIKCDMEEISSLLDVIDPGKGNFFFVISENETARTLQFQCDRLDRIEVSVTDRNKQGYYIGELVFPGDMMYLMKDHFSGADVIERYGLKKGDI
jgi:hypothetical protein